METNTNGWKARIPTIFAAALVLGLLVPAGTADPPGATPAEHHAQVMAAINGVGDQVAGLALELDVQAAVDTAPCATVPVQCGGSGHSYEAASSSNHNPIRIGILVTSLGEPVSDLVLADVSFENPFVPAGGGAATHFDCGAECFQPGGNGLYQFWAHRSPEGTWTAGHYFGRIGVTTASGQVGSALVDWNIV